MSGWPETGSWVEEMERLREENAGLRTIINDAHTLAYLAPDLNPSNYSHDDVCELNSKMNEVFDVLREGVDASAPLEGETAGHVGETGE